MRGDIDLGDTQYSWPTGSERPCEPRSRQALVSPFPSRPDGSWRKYGANKALTRH